MSNQILADLFLSLNIVVLERIDIGLFKITSKVPDWLRRFCSQELTVGMNMLIPQEEFAFLENFLFDAEEFWHNNSSGKLSSGLWIEKNLNGYEEQLEAYAICINYSKILLIELVRDKYQDKQNLIQIGRQQELNYQHLLKENQKKEVLINCIIHDIAGQLTAINCCLSLLEFESLTAKGKENLEIARKQSLKQEMLIRNILDAFSADVRSLETFVADIDTAPDILVAIQENLELFNSTFSLSNKQLQFVANTDITADWKVVGEQSRLDRIITNLVENAYRYSPPESTVTIGLQAEEESVLFTIDDEGAGVQPEMIENLFQKFSQGQNNSGRAGIGLYFCRMTIERWGGNIGYLPRQEGGSRFWFRLPRPRTGV
ncbi:HAMP domain-containing histidine kinase [Nostoc sp. FACHB-152]|uniref:sensor histidine kinase n=1 Tax=unclassified Nostoc TaxID=2593658 RepID=UPI001683000D|nr:MULTISPECIES: HAMP domain-containing sensor histidine kinase [unclassified Nostoc]MBD2447656.1 HAMP domain-containing histidine kinase [Nostoc sp. FACHB-152]MBD2470647.1 HAMP domain-containing histidine kinase [Nostoc sp. FACHB-145]